MLYRGNLSCVSRNLMYVLRYLHTRWFDDVAVRFVLRFLGLSYFKQLFFALSKNVLKQSVEKVTFIHSPWILMCVCWLCVFAICIWSCLLM